MSDKNYIVKESLLKGVADAIRGKKGTTEPILSDDFASEIEGIQSGGGENRFAQYINDTLEEVTEQDLQGLTSLRNYVFYECKNLVDVDIPNTVTSMGDYAFYSCVKLANVKMSNAVTTLGRYAFYNCKILPSIEIPSTLTKVEDDAFHYCEKLNNIYIEDINAWMNITFADGYHANYSPTFYTKNALGEYEPITELVIPNTLTEIKSYTFKNFAFESVMFEEGSQIVTIGSYAFNGCKNLKNINIPYGVTTIDTQCFSSCSGLENAEISESVSKLGTYAFQNCTSLKNVTIGAGITNIGGQAFAGCKALERVRIYATTPPTIQSNTFNSVPTTCIIEVPAEAVETYKGWTNWSARADQIIVIEE